MYFLFRAALFDHNVIQNGGHQLRVDAAFEGELPFESGFHFAQLLGGDGAFLGFLLQKYYLLLLFLQLLIKAVIAGFELLHGNGSRNAHFQQSVLFGLEAGHFLLNSEDVSLIVVVSRH